MHVIRQNHKRMELIALKSTVPITQSFNYHVRDFRLSEKPGTPSGCIKDPIHRNERFPVVHYLLRENAV